MSDTAKRRNRVSRYPWPEMKNIGDCFDASVRPGEDPSKRRAHVASCGKKFAKRLHAQTGERRKFATRLMGDGTFIRVWRVDMNTCTHSKNLPVPQHPTHRVANPQGGEFYERRIDDTPERDRLTLDDIRRVEQSFGIAPHLVFTRAMINNDAEFMGQAQLDEMRDHSRDAMAYAIARHPKPKPLSKWQRYWRGLWRSVKDLGLAIIGKPRRLFPSMDFKAGDYVAIGRDGVAKKVKP